MLKIGVKRKCEQFQRQHAVSVLMKFAQFGEENKRQYCDGLFDFQPQNFEYNTTQTSKCLVSNGKSRIVSIH